MFRARSPAHGPHVLFISSDFPYLPQPRHRPARSGRGRLIRTSWRSGRSRSTMAKTPWATKTTRKSGPSAYTMHGVSSRGRVETDCDVAPQRICPSALGCRCSYCVASSGERRCAAACRHRRDNTVLFAAYSSSHRIFEPEQSSQGSMMALRPRRRRRLNSQKSGTESPEVRRDMIWTPDVTRVCSKRAFDGLVSVTCETLLHITEHAQAG